MPKIRIKIRKKSGKRSRIPDDGYEHLSPEKRRKIEELMLARQRKEGNEEIPGEEAPEPAEDQVAQLSPPPTTPELSLVEEPEAGPPPEPPFVKEPEFKAPEIEEPASAPAEDQMAQPPPFPTSPEPSLVEEPETGPLPEPAFVEEPIPEKEAVVAKDIPSRIDIPLKKDVSLRKRDRTCRKIIEWGILGLLLFSPLPAASVHEWSMLLIQLTVFILFGTYLLIHEKPDLNPYLAESLKWPRYLFVALFVLIFLQFLPLPAFLVKIFSPKVHAFRELFLPGPAGTHFMGLSLIPSHTFREALRLIPYFLLGFLVIKTIRTQAQIMRILYVLIGMSVFQALYGFFELQTSHPKILFYEKQHYLDAVTGTFINRNHLSGYLEMVVPLAIAVVLARTDFFSFSGMSWREKMVKFWDKGVLERVFIPISIVLMSLAIIFSKSRSGIFLLLLTFLIFFEVSIFFYRKYTRRKIRSSRFLKFTFLLITILALYIGIDGVIKRFSMERFRNEYRSFYWAQTADIVGDFPVFGSGLGTFASVYPAYDRKMIPAQFSHAHNDYLEYLSELGILGLICLFGGIVIFLIKSFLVWRERSHPQVKALALGGILSITLLLLHSITDFNLHIPANMLLFSVILSLTVVIAFHKVGENESGGADEPLGEIRVHPLDSGGQFTELEQQEWQKFIRKNRKPVSKEIAILVILFLGFLAAVSLAIYWNHHLYSVGKNTVDKTRKIGILEQANAVYTKNDLAYYELGVANQTLGLQETEFAEVRMARMQDSRDNFERSLTINPLSAYSHLHFAKTLQSLSTMISQSRKPTGNQQLPPSTGQDPVTLQARALQEYKKAVMLAAHHKPIYLGVGKILFSHWDELSEEDKNFTRNFLKKMSPHVQNEDLVELMQVWAENVKDYSIMDLILPDGIQAYKMYVKLLGEKSLSHEERLRYQAKVESIRFKSAKRRHKAGDNELVYRKTEAALAHFEKALDILGSVRFYQNLSSGHSIDVDEFVDLKKSCLLMTAKCRLITGQAFEDVEPLLKRYVQLEEKEAALHDLEVFLRNRGILRESIASDLDALDLIAFQIRLNFKQGRYRDIIEAGRALEIDYMVLTAAERKIYAQLMHLVGDAFLKQDFMYDAAAYYRKALEVDPNNLEMLFGIRTSYARINDENMIRQLDGMIERVLSPKEKVFEDVVVRKENAFSYPMKLDGKRIVLRLNFKGLDEGVEPLVAVFFNDVVVWENYAGEGELSLRLNPLAGRNKLVISPVNTDIVLKSIIYQ